jgi:hypothetical protein
VVGYDWIILPGRVGSVTESVNLSNYHAGSYTKTATIMSNAKTSASFAISMKWVMKAYVSVAPTYLSFSKDPKGIFQLEVTLTSEKKDLKLLEVSFKPREDNPTNVKPDTWKEELPAKITFTLVKDSAVAANMHEYKYKLTATNISTQRKDGEFFLKTNHPDGPEVKVSGVIEPGTVK